MNKKISKAIEQAIKQIELMRKGQADSDEPNVRYSLINPIIKALDWNISDQEQCLVEKNSDPKKNREKADYILCKGRDYPMVFIEAKKLGSKELDNGEGEGQLVGYAKGQHGDYLLILTDGNTWKFYLTMRGGRDPELYYRVSLSENKERVDDYAEYFVEYLKRNKVHSGKAFNKAESRFVAKNNISKVWYAMLNGSNSDFPDLCDLLGQAVKNDCRIRPDQDDLNDFLERQAKLSQDLAKVRAKLEKTQGKNAEEGQSTTSKSKPVDKPKGKGSSSGYTKIIRYTLYGKPGKPYCPGSGRRTFEAILKHLGERNPDFMQQFYEKLMEMRRRWVIAPNRNDLLDGEDDMGDDVVDLENGWWFYQKRSTKKMISCIKIACEIAGIEYDSKDGLKLISDDE